MKDNQITAYTNDAPMVGRKVKVAYCRLTKEMNDFLELVNENDDIVGFEWTPGEYIFGIIVKE